MDSTKVFSHLGVPWEEVRRRLDEELPAAAYKPIPGGAKLTDVNHAYAYPIMDELFGPFGYGWGLEWETVEVHERQTARGGTTYVAIVPRAVFWYRIVILRGDGRSEERIAVAVSGGSENASPWYAMKGAVTNALGSGLATIGWQASVYRGERTHETVGRGKRTDRRAQPRKPTQPQPQTPPPPAASDAPTSPRPREAVLRELTALHDRHKGHQATQRQRGLMYGVLKLLLPSDEDAKRFWVSVTGLESTRDPAAGPWVLALLDWLQPTKRGGRWSAGRTEEEGARIAAEVTALVSSSKEG